MAEIRQLRIDQLYLGNVNVREDIGPLDELVESIRAQGVVNPIIVRPREGRYEIVAGRRRYEASKLAGREEISAVVEDVDDIRAIVTSLSENWARNNLSLNEEARAFLRLKEMVKTFDQVSKITGKPKSYITNAVDAYELSRSTGIPVEPRVVKVEPTPEGISLPKEIGSRLGRTLRQKRVVAKLKKLPEEEKQEKVKRLAEELSVLPQEEAIKVIRKFKQEPLKPVEELVKEAVAEPEPLTVTVYFPKEVAAIVTKIAEEKEMTVNRWVTMVVENYLVNAGYKITGQRPLPYS